MDARELKTAVFEQFARIASAFASPKRIEILDVLAQGERSVETLAEEAGLSTANASRHLQILKTIGLLASRREGVQVLYRLADESVLDGYRALRVLAEARSAELDRLARDYFAGGDGFDPVGRDELLRRAKEGEVTVLDVRPTEEFRAGHIAGARSIPLAELTARLSELPSGRPVIAYCRGPYCVLALEAVRLLREQGFPAGRLADGYPEWRRAGGAVAHGGEAAASR